MCDYVIWNAIFGAMDELRVAHRIRSYTTLAFAAVNDGVDEYIIGSMNSASGLVAANFRRAIPGVGYFSISSRPTGGVVQVVPEGPIERSDNRHAEMNIVSFLLAQHLTRNEENTVANFFLDDYLIELLPSQVFCPECQLALCLLSRGAARLFSSISELIRRGGDPTLVIRGVRDHMLSPNWQPPWTSYFADIPGSGYFRNLQGNERNFPYLIGHEGGGAVIYTWDGDIEDWAAVARIDTAWRD